MADQPRIESLLRQAIAAHEAGDLSGAEALYRQVLDLEPTHGEALGRCTGIVYQSGRHQDALPIIDAAASADPTNAAWPIGRALVLTTLGRHADAAAAYDRAIALRPAESTFHYARAIALFSDDRDAEALSALDTALALQPDDVEGHYARGETLLRLRRYDEALAAYDRAIEIQGDCAKALFAKAQLLLLMGRYNEGWPLYEWRWHSPTGSRQRRSFAQPLWDGQPLRGRTLLVHAEQGLGDAIQFYRFVLQARLLGKVVLLASSKLLRLFDSQPGAPIVVSEASNLPHFDLHIPMLSLPLRLAPELAVIHPVPYLMADSALVAAWRKRLRAAPGRLRIGIVWAGEKSHTNDRKRSISLSTMLEIFDPDTPLVSLQKDVPESDRATLRDKTHVLDLSGGLADFADTAAVVSQLDLIISVDTAVAHLAGALGTPVWVLLTNPPEWRWLVDRDDSPWYSSARLFRQEEPGDWQGVVQRVRAALKARSVPKGMTAAF